MKHLLALRALASLPLALSMQDKASPAPTSGTIRDLELGDLNFLHTTDTHAWHAGHLKQGLYSADWGDYVTFANLLRDKLEAQKKDLLIVDTGDRIRGNGLYGADDNPGTITNEILKEQALHALTTGNHELYYPNTTLFEYENVVPEYDDYTYLIGNLQIRESEESKIFKPFSPFAVKTHVTKMTGLKVTTIGLIHNKAVLRGNNIARVIPVKTAVTQTWFLNAIRDSDVDVFVIIGHIPARPGPPDSVPKDRYLERNDTDTEFKDVHDAIRHCNCRNSDKPIHFFGGDYHIRDYKIYDGTSRVLASGMYSETIGFASIDGLRANGAKGPLKFSRRYIDNNLFSFMHHTGKYGSDFVSEQGTKVTKLITEKRGKLGLDEVYGCTPRNLWMGHVNAEHNNSVYAWISKEVFKTGVGPPGREKTPRLMYMNSGSIRYDVYKGEFTKDTAWSINPFESPLVYIPDVPYDLAKDLPNTIDKSSIDEHTDDLEMEMLMPPHLRNLREDCPVFGNPLTASQIPLSSDDPSEKKAPLGYVTKDDLGNDGDDTVHDPIRNCRPPRTISGVNYDEEKPPETVDVVFNEYLVTKTLAQLVKHDDKYTLECVKSYGPEAGKSQELRDFMSDWVKANWPKQEGGISCPPEKPSASDVEIKEL